MSNLIADTNIEEWPFERSIAEPDKWHPMTEEHYWYCLEVLPPIYLKGGFAVSEPWKHDEQGRPMYFCVAVIGKRYFGRHLTVQEANVEIPKLRQELGA